MIRPSVYADRWYPTTKAEIEEYLYPKLPKRKAIAGICPHAGWLYSGKVAGEVFSSMEPAKLYILIGPNHRGTGAPVSVFPGGAWRTPLGNLEVDKDAAASIIEKSQVAKPDTVAHDKEHSLEVQMPFIKYFSPAAKIVPITLADYRMHVCQSLGEAIAGTIVEKGLKNDAVIIASTDMSHYVPADMARSLDHRAIQEILRLDADGLMKTVSEQEISMCGSGPTVVAINASRILGAKGATLIRYATSGEVTEEYQQVVGYAGIIIT